MTDNIKKTLIGVLGFIVLVIGFGLKNDWFKSEESIDEKGIERYEKVPVNPNKKANLDVIKEKNKQKISEIKLNKTIRSTASFYENEENHSPFSKDEEPEINEETEVTSQVQAETVKKPVEKEVVVKYVRVESEQQDSKSNGKESKTKVRRSRRSSGNAFYGSDDIDSPDDKKDMGSGFTKAVIYGDHSLRSGDNVNIRLIQDLIWNGNTIKRGSFINGTAQMKSGRMFITVKDLLVNENVVSVLAKIYDGKDASEGLYVPGGVDKEIKDDILNDAIDESTVRVNIPFVGSIKSGAKKKSKDRIVKILSGHKILVKIDEK